MTDTADKGIVHEFDWLDPTELHLVRMGANGFSPLVAKAAEEVGNVIEDAGALTKARWAGFCGEGKCLFCKETFGPSFESLVEKARLKTKERNKLPASAFALPGTREYPIHDENHARAALSMLHNATPEQQAKIKAAVHARYPEIGDDVKTKKEGAPQASHEDKPVPSPEGSLAQTKENHPHMGAIHMDVTPDGHVVISPPFSGHPAPSADQEGHGSTAPEKTLPMSEALSQTKANLQKEGSGDGRGDPMPGGPVLDANALAEAKTQTEEVHRKATPGDAEWEAHDAALAEEAGHLIEQLESREKAEESGGAEKRVLSPAAKETIRRTAEVAQRFLDANAAKESDEVAIEDVIKALDERKALRKAEKKEAKKAEAKKAKMKADKKKMKMMEDDKEMAEKIAADPEYAAKLQLVKDAKAVAKAAKSSGKLSAVTKSIEELSSGLSEAQKLLEKIAAQPMPTPMLSQAGIDAAGIIARAGGATAALRGPAGTPLIKERAAGEAWKVDDVRRELLAEHGISV